jgi:VanZ family protein
LRTSGAKLWFWITLFYTIATFGLSSIANPPRFLVTKYHLDWWLHGVEYGLLAVCLMKYQAAGGVTIPRIPFTVQTMFFIALVGGMNELLQVFIPKRAPSWADEIANIAGAAVFISIYHGLRVLNERREALQPEEEG